MSESEEPTIDDSDIAAVETAVDGLLDKAQANLGFAYTTASPAPAPSVALDYHIYAGIEVYLTTQWSLFEGLTLTGITLKVAIEKYKNAPATLFVELSATATIGDFDFTVTGRIPRLSTNEDITFILIIQLESTLPSLDPNAFVGALTNQGYVFSNATDKLGSDLSSQVEDESSTAGTSFSTGALIYITKPAKGSTFLQRLEVGFASDINWTIVPGAVALTGVALGLVLDHPTSSSPWTATMDIDATVVVQDAKLQASGEISLGDMPSISLAVTAGPSNGSAPEALLDQFIGAGTGDTLDADLVVPPDAEPTSDENEDPFEAAITFQKDTKGWYIQNANTRLFWQTDCFFPIEGVNIALQELYFQYLASREPPTSDKQPSDMPLDFSAAFGGKLVLFNLPLAAVVTYQSAVGNPPTSQTVITAVVGDTQSVSLQQVAADAMLNPPTGSPRDINAVPAGTNVPDSAPVDLTWCTSAAGSSGAKCVLTFIGSDLARLSLWANYQLDWQITSFLTIGAMGIYFDITNPTSSTLASVVKGYGYGSVVISDNVDVFAFVAGISQTSGTRDFLVGLSLSYDPTASAGVSPSTIFSSTKFLGDSPPADSNWILPSSAPGDVTVSDTITSINANVLVRINQTPDALMNYTTTIVNMEASLQVTGSWQIFSNVNLTQVALKIIVVPGTPATNNKISYYAQLLGVVSSDLSTVNNTQYIVVLTAMILYNAKEQSGLFTASVSAYYLGAPTNDVPISTFLSMPLIGADPNAVQNDPSAKILPSELGLSTSALLGKPVAQCALTVKNISNVWTLSAFSAQLTQAEAWTIIPDKLSITNSSLYLQITNPSSPQRLVQFSAGTTIVIGSTTFINAAITATAGGDGTSNSVKIIVSASNFDDAVNALIGAPVTVPQDCPVLNDGYSASTTITCKKDNTGSWGLATLDVEVSATNLTTWNLGPISVTSLSLSAKYDYTTSPCTTTITVFGSAIISGMTVNLAITLTDTSTLSVVITTSLEPLQLVNQVSNGGLNNAPDVTADSGLSNYETMDCVSAGIVFKRDSSWYADNLYLKVASSKNHWAMVSDVLWAEDLYLMLALNNLRTSSQLSVIMGINFGFKPPSGFSGTPSVPCSLTVTSKQLEGFVDTSACTVSSFLYIATAGYWDPPEILNIHILKSLTLTMDWDDGSGSFVATCFDWNLSETLPKIAAMTNPRLVVSMSREGGGFEAEGQLAGTAYLLGVPIDLSYDLADGPFRVFGIDIKEAYQMAQRLYNLLKDIEELADVLTELSEFMAELAEFAGLADIAADIFAGLTALGVAKDILSGILDSIFGDDGSGGGGGGGNDDPSNNGGGGGHTSPYLVVGGSALSAGPSNTSCSLVVYPNDKNNKYLQPFDSTQLAVQVQGGDQSWSALQVNWTAIASGVSTNYQRPANPSAMRVLYTGLTPNLEYDYQNTIQAQASVFSLAQSTIDYPQSIGVNVQGLIILTPRDQYGQPRLGPGAAPTLGVNFPGATYDQTKGFVIRNDSLLLQYTLASVGSYTLTITDPSDTSSQPRACTIAGVNALDPNECTEYGEGLCSGVANGLVNFYIGLKDQGGKPYTPLPNEKVRLYITLSVNGSQADPLLLPYAIAGSTVTVSYTRPSAGTYSINITLNDVLLNAAPFYLTSTTAAVSPSINKSTFTVASTLGPAGVIAAGDQLVGQIVVYDNLGSRWYQAIPNDTFNLVWPVGFTGGTYNDNGDGTASFSAFSSSTFPNTTATLAINSPSDPTQQCIGSPLNLLIKAPRKLASISPYGSGMDSGHNDQTSVTVGGQDQYGVNFNPRFGQDYTVILSHARSEIAWSDSGWSTFTYFRPSASSEPLAMLIKPLKSWAFNQSLYLVPLQEPSTTHPDQCFVTWNTLSQTDNSTLTLYAVDHNGQRRREGGDLVQTLSAPNCPLIITLAVIDNLDGSYSISIMLPAAAFTAQTPAPQLQLSVNGASIAGSPITFPLSQQPFATVTAAGPGLTNALVGMPASFQLTTSDASGLLTMGGFENAQVILMQRDTGPWMTATVGSDDHGVVTVDYNISSDMGPGTYTCYMFVNSLQIAPPATINVRNPTIDDFDQACLITNYTLASPSSQWSVGDGDSNDDASFWNYDYTSVPNAVILSAATGAYQGATTPLKLGLNMPATEQWFKNGGIMFQFDVSIFSQAPITLAPYTQPDQAVTMVWNPYYDDNGEDPEQATVEWQIGGNAITVQNAQWTTVTPTKTSTISYLYLLDNDLQNYRIYIFQAGQLITTGSYARNAANPTASLPILGLTITRSGPSGCKLTFSNISTIPTYFRSAAGALESSSDIIWSEPWAKNYVTIANGDGNLSATGLVIPAHTDPNSGEVNNPWIYQYAPLTYGQSVAVYTFTASKWYDLDPHKGPPEGPLIPAILFGNAFWDPERSTWVQWDDKSVTDITPSSLVISPTQVNTVMVIMGHDTTTVFSNGQFAFSQTVSGKDGVAELMSWWVDMVWKAMRCSPPLRIAQ